MNLSIKRLTALRCISVACLMTLIASSSSAQFFGGGRGGWGGERNIPMMERFDRDKNGYLDKTERKAALDALGEDAEVYSGDSSNKVKGGKLTPAQVKSYPGKSLYDPTVLRTLFLTFEDANWEAELMAFHGTDIDIPAGATMDGKSYKNVGVHFRGMTSFMSVPYGYKHSLKLAFEFLDKDQTVLGYRGLELLNGAADPTFLRNVLYMQIERDYIPAPKANFMRVVINGESWGVYPNVQAFNSDFVEEIGGGKGARWKVPGSPNARGGLEYFGDDPAVYKSIFEIKSKDKPESWAALINLCKVLNQTPPAKLEAALKPILDIDDTLKFLAIDNTLVNNDGYWVRGSDYSLYQDGEGRFHLTPQDANETLRPLEQTGRGNRMRRANPEPGVRYDISLDPLVSLSDETKPLYSKLLAVPALKQRYLNYVRDINNKWLDWSRLGPIAQQYQALIGEDVKADVHKLYSLDEFTGGLAQDMDSDGFGPVTAPGMSLKSFVQQRHAFLQKYFANAANSSAASAGHAGT
jgi:hypothetical protein